MPGGVKLTFGFCCPQIPSQTFKLLTQNLVTSESEFQNN